MAERGPVQPTVPSLAAVVFFAKLFKRPAWGASCHQNPVPGSWAMLNRLNRLAGRSLNKTFFMTDKTLFATEKILSVMGEDFRCDGPNLLQPNASLLNLRLNLLQAGQDNSRHALSKIQDNPIKKTLVREKTARTKK